MWYLVRDSFIQDKQEFDSSQKKYTDAAHSQRTVVRSAGLTRNSCARRLKCGNIYQTMCPAPAALQCCDCIHIARLCLRGKDTGYSCRIARNESCRKHYISVKDRGLARMTPQVSLIATLESLSKRSDDPPDAARSQA